MKYHRTINEIIGEDMARELTIGHEALLQDGSDDDFRNMLHDMLSLFIGLEDIREGFGAYIGLSGPQYTMLAAIRHLQGETGVGVKMLADHLGLSGAFVTIETKKLARLGVIHKKTNPDDHRRVNLTLAPRGIELLRQLAPLQREINDVIFDELSSTEFHQLCGILRRLRQNIGRARSLANYLLDDGKDEK
ncbi:MAG: MarR family winged helix-turn-helix transcriptional regulator [Pseudorhodobacter sp.]